MVKYEAQTHDSWTCVSTFNPSFIYNMTLGLRSGIVQLAPFDAAWANAFSDERTRIASLLGALPAAIEHIGSTAVPGLVAKPILDILVGRPPESELAPYVTTLVAAGYSYRGESGVTGREYFVRDSSDSLRTHHLHLVAQHGNIWKSHVAFRDCLLREPARMAAYAELKLALAARHPDDRVAYTDGKAEFIAHTILAASVLWPF